MKRIISLLFIPIYKHVQDIHLSLEPKIGQDEESKKYLFIAKLRTNLSQFRVFRVVVSVSVSIRGAIKIHFRFRRATIRSNNG